MEPLLSLSHLVKHYATQKAVDDISFDIQKGSIFGLLGPNGAGKTTLLRMITGIFYPDGGEIKLDGKKFDPLLDIREIGYMPEERGLYKKMKIGEQALYLAQLRGLSKADAMEKIKYWFEKFEMQSWWNKKVEDLSKGMSQKLQFVITVLHEPKLIILDEPFSGLDPLNANLIKDEIYNLAKKGATIIFSTHRMEQVEEICDHIVLVNLGKKVLDGSVAEIKQQFKEYIFAIETSHPELIKDNTLFTIIDKADKNPNKILVKLSQAVASNEVLKYLIEQQIPIVSYNEVLPSLNDIFIQLVEDTHAKARAFQNI
ncbi:MAG: ATP-binding cassette domain-containing protein [Chitinophagaceae bacterium]|nr:ATP-binding cassette domain-containing protein [Chitinophagaceae bacterium]